MANNTEFDMRQSEETWRDFRRLAMWVAGASILTMVLLALFVA